MPHTLSPHQIDNLLNPELTFRLDQWTESGSIEKTLAWVDDFEVARAAFDKACALYPDKILTLRKKAWVIAKHEPRGP